VVARDPELRNAPRTPLILSLVVLTYNDLRDEDVPRVDNLSSWRHHLFERYVDRMLRHRPGMAQQKIHYLDDEVRRALAWLGYELRLHHEGAFYLEWHYADWLPDPSSTFDSDLSTAHVADACERGHILWSVRRVAIRDILLVARRSSCFIGSLGRLMDRLSC
jgi:hypothetical protein